MKKKKKIMKLTITFACSVLCELTVGAYRDYRYICLFARVPFRVRDLASGRGLDPTMIFC